MNPANEPHDEELRELLRELGRARERRAPAFQRVWHGADAVRETAAQHRLLGWIAVAAAVVIALCFFMLPGRVQQNRPPPAFGAAEVETDPLPTDFLLTINNEDLVERIAGEIDALLRP